MDNQIGHMIKMARKKMGLTQKQLAEGICTQAEISRIEAGKTLPCADILYKICKKLGIQVDYLFTNSCDEDYLAMTMRVLRELVQEKKYDELLYLVKKEQNNPCFQEPYYKKFLLWHKGIGEYFSNQGCKESALADLEKALSIKVADMNLDEINIQIRMSIANILSEQNKIECSISIYQQCLTNWNQLIQPQDPYVKLRILFNLCLTLSKINQFENVLHYGQKGINECLKFRTNYLLGEFYYYMCYASFHLSIPLALEYGKRAYFIFYATNKTQYLDKTKQLLKIIKKLDK